MNDLIERLRAVKWEVTDDGDRMPDDPTHQCVFVDMRSDDFRALLREAAAAIEAAEKDIALKEKLIDALGLGLNAAAHERDNLRAEVESWKGLAQQFGNELDTVRAKIAEMEKQEPVAFALYSGWARKAVYLSEIEACEQRDRRQLTADLGGSLEAYRVVPLYPAPGAKGE